ncbi:MAG: MBL fold metallo-hydrolase [Candidatus ainarchaeum sp.]|nr:MBL fold metallo-hydrolase [Candidatus ainarchaeum sp.]
MLKQIFPNLFFFQSPSEGSNVFLIAGKNPALIDSSSKSNASLLKSSIEKAGFDCNEIRLVLHTHGHADHFGCDFLFPNAEIWMHEFDAKFVNLKDAVFTFANCIPADFPKICSFFREKQIIDLGNFKLKVLFTPGHTKGSVCFFDGKNKLLFSGDTLFSGGVGRADLPSGNPAELKASLEKISKLKFNFLLPGHGEILQGGQKANVQFALKSLGNSFL